MLLLHLSPFNLCSASMARTVAHSLTPSLPSFLPPCCLLAAQNMRLLMQLFRQLSVRPPWGPTSATQLCLLKMSSAQTPARMNVLFVPDFEGDSRKAQWQRKAPAPSPINTSNLLQSASAPDSASATSLASSDGSPFRSSGPEVDSVLQTPHRGAPSPDGDFSDGSEEEEDERDGSHGGAIGVGDIDEDDKEGDEDSDDGDDDDDDGDAYGDMELVLDTIGRDKPRRRSSVSDARRRASSADAASLDLVASLPATVVVDSGGNAASAAASADPAIVATAAAAAASTGDATPACDAGSNSDASPTSLAVAVSSCADQTGAPPVPSVDAESHASSPEVLPPAPVTVFRSESADAVASLFDTAVADDAIPSGTGSSGEPSPHQSVAIDASSSTHGAPPMLPATDASATCVAANDDTAASDSTAALTEPALEPAPVSPAPLHTGESAAPPVIPALDTSLHQTEEQEWQVVDFNRSTLGAPVVYATDCQMVRTVA